MAEYSKEKLYFLKIPKDFFQNHEIRVLEGMENGFRYELIYLKLMLESVSHNGFLRFSKEIAYTPKMIASITNNDIDTVMVALKVLEGLELVTTTAEGSIFIPKVQELTGITTEGAEKKRIQRGGQKVDIGWTKGGQGVDKCPPNEEAKLPLGSQEDSEGGQKGDKCPPDIRVKSLEIRDKSLEESKQVKTSHKQIKLCDILVRFGFLEEDELQDPAWDDLMDLYVRQYGYVDTKIKLEYVLKSHSDFEKDGLDANGKPTFRHFFNHQGIANRFSWLAAAMDKGFERLKPSEPANDDDLF